MSRSDNFTLKPIAQAIAMTLAAGAAPAALAGTGSCPAADNTISTASVMSCNLVAGDSVTVTAAGSITSGGFAPINVGAAAAAASITNAGTLNGVFGGIGLFTGASVTGAVTNSGAINVTGGNSIAGIGSFGGTDFAGGIDNSGSITVMGGTAFGGIVIGPVGNVSGGVTNSGSVTVTGMGAAVGIGSSNLGMSDFAGGITNSGSISVDVGMGNIATGVSSAFGGSDISGGLINEEGGTITASANALAFGVGVQTMSDISGGVTNAGTISASGRVFLAGIGVGSTSDISGGITNSGTIKGVGLTSIGGIGVIGNSDISGGIENSGTISADGGAAGFRILGINSALGADISGGVENSGTISAAGSSVVVGVNVASMGDISGGVTNTGSISATASGAAALAEGIGVFNNADISGGINNSGMIEASGGVPTGLGFSSGGHGIWVGAASQISGGIVNSGTIKGNTTSLQLLNMANPFDVTLNGGTFDGAVNLGINRLMLTGEGFKILGAVTGVAGSTVTVTGTASSGSDITVAGVDSFTIANDALFSLSHNLTSSATVMNHGTLIAGSNRTATITGDYTQTATGSFKSQVRSPTQFGKLNVSGTADISANDKIAIEVSSDATLVGGDTLNDVVTAGTLTSGGTVTVEEDSFLLGFNATVDGNTIDVNVEQEVTFENAVAAVADTTPGAAPVAAALDAIIADGALTETLRDELGALSSLTSAGAVGKALGQLVPALAGAAEVGTQRVTNLTTQAFTNRLNSRRGNPALAAGDTFGVKNFWAVPFGSWTDHDDQGANFGFDAQTWGVAVGVDGTLSWNPRWTVGVGFSYGASEVDSNNPLTRGQVDVNSYQGLLYASYEYDPMTTFSIIGGVGGLDNESSRRIQIGNIDDTATADYDGWSGFVNLEAARDYTMSDRFTMTPYIAFEYTHVDLDGYTEAGADGFNLAVASNDVDSAIFLIGSRANWELTSRFDWNFEGAVGVDAVDDDGRSVAAFAAGGPSFVTQGIDPDAFRARAGTGISLHNDADTVALEANYRIEVNDDLLHHQGTIQFRANW